MTERGLSERVWAQRPPRLAPIRLIAPGRARRCDLDGEAEWCCQTRVAARQWRGSLLDVDGTSSYLGVRRAGPVGGVPRWARRLGPCRVTATGPSVVGTT